MTTTRFCDTMLGQNDEFCGKFEYEQKKNGYRANERTLNVLLLFIGAIGLIFIFALRYIVLYAHVYCLSIVWSSSNGASMVFVPLPTTHQL